MFIENYSVFFVKAEVFTLENGSERGDFVVGNRKNDMMMDKSCPLYHWRKSSNSILHPNPQKVPFLLAINKPIEKRRVVKP